MKKLLFGMMAFVAFVATSCQQAPEELNVVAGGDANVTFSVGAPQIANRAYSDGLTATRLQYAVYAVSEANSTKSLSLLSDLKGTETLDELKTSINLQLTTGNKYAVVFWADQPDNTHYKVTFDPATVTVDVLDYASAKSNDETRDAFYAVHEFTVSGTQTETVYLKRPFAQLNIGANDFLASEKAGHKVTHAKVTVPAYSTLDLVSGVADNQTSVTFDYAAVPTGETFPVANYEYLAMNYLLMNTAEEVVDLTFYYATDKDGANEKSRVVGSVPFQRNHRTNIYGQLFTGDVTVNVTIEKGYEDDMHNGVIEVVTAEQFAAAFADPDVDFIVLANDVNLTTSAARTNPTFTVSAGESLTINLDGHRLTASSAQLFDVEGTLTIQNGTIENTNGQVFDNNDDVKFSNATILQTTDSAYYDEQGGKLELLAEGVVKVSDTEIAVTASCGMSWFDKNLDAYNGFEGITIKLETDVDLSASSWDGIGDGRTGAAFKGTFDGQDKVIYGAHFSDPNQFTGGLFGDDRGLGLFSVVDGATIKNINLDNACFASYTIVAGGIAAYATDTTFENIKINDTKISCYNWTAGGVVGQAEGTCTFKGIEIDSDTVVGSLWDSYGTYAGGIAGAVDGSSNIVIEDCTISCVLDVINDVTSNYKWCIYRIAGMIIGETHTTAGIYNDVATATVTNVTCKNVTVNYGQWMNYHYCQGYWGRGWGRVESSDYIDGVDHTQCNHPEGEEHCVCFPFDQLFGGGQNGTGHYPIKGIAEFPGVTVNYPAEYTCPTCGQQHNVK